MVDGRQWIEDHVTAAANIDYELSEERKKRRRREEMDEGGGGSRLLQCFSLHEPLLLLLLPGVLNGKVILLRRLAVAEGRCRLVEGVRMYSMYLCVFVQHSHMVKKITRCHGISSEGSYVGIVTYRNVTEATDV